MHKQIMPHRSTAVAVTARQTEIRVNTPFKDFVLSIPANTSPLRISAALQAFERYLNTPADRTTEDSTPLVAFSEEAAMHNVETEVIRAEAEHPDDVPLEAQAIVSDVPPVTAEERRIVHDAAEGIGLDASGIAADTEFTMTGLPSAVWPFPGDASDVDFSEEQMDVGSVALENTESYGPTGVPMSDAFQHDLEELINRHSMEDRFGLPDYIIAEMVVNHMNATAHALWRNVQRSNG